MSPYLTESFTEEELACRHCGRFQFHPGFLEDLQALRRDFAREMKVLSGARCAVHNAAVGGHPKSLHVLDVEQHPGMRGALAVDIWTPDGKYRGDLFATAWTYGWSVGWNAKKGFLHLDRRVALGLPQTSFDY